MPKKHKRNAAKIAKQPQSVNLKAWISKRTSGEWVIALVLLLGLGVIAKYAVTVLQEKMMYSAAEKEINNFSEEASRLAPSTLDKYSGCSRSSAKFEKGSLGCNVGGNVTYHNVTITEVKKITRSLDALQDHLAWDFDFDNSKSNHASYPNAISVKVYKYKQLTCSVSYEYLRKDLYGQDFDSTSIKLGVSCTGSARLDYY